MKQQLTDKDRIDYLARRGRAPQHWLGKWVMVLDTYVLMRRTYRACLDAGILAQRRAKAAK